MKVSARRASFPSDQRNKKWKVTLSSLPDAVNGFFHCDQLPLKDFHLPSMLMLDTHESAYAAAFPGIATTIRIAL
jgi:hypothetical protein